MLRDEEGIIAPSRTDPSWWLFLTATIEVEGGVKYRDSPPQHSPNVSYREGDGNRM